MDALFAGIVILALLIAVTCALPFAYAAWRRVVARDSDLQIWRVMRRRGIVRDPAARPDAKLARAVRRCVLCPSIEECDDWLASQRNDGLAEFCPNATLFDGLSTPEHQRNNR